MTFDQLLATDYRDYTVALFYGPRCAPCELLKPMLADACRDLGARLETFNSAAELDACRRLDIRSTPTVLLVRKGAVKLAFAGNPGYVNTVKKMLMEAGLDPR